MVAADDEGTVYSINADGTGYQVLHSFTGTASDGNEPVPGLTVVGSTLVGVTSAGGSSNDGVVFSINTDGPGFSLCAFVPWAPMVPSQAM